MRTITNSPATPAMRCHPILRFLAVTVSLVVAAGAQAGAGVVRVPVESVHPVYTLERRPVQVRTCEVVPVRRQTVSRVSVGSGHRAHAPRRDRRLGRALVGGVIGGTIGRPFGEGRGRDAMAVAGALLGARIAAGPPDRPPVARRRIDTRIVHEEVCRDVEDTRTREVLVGYDVSFRWRGRTFVQRRASHPGEHLTISYGVTPKIDED